MRNASEESMTRKFDVIAIGTGSAASAVASRCSEAGWKVAIVDSRPFGGTCALRGCDPKKVLVGTSNPFDPLPKNRNPHAVLSRFVIFAPCHGRETGVARYGGRCGV